MKKYREYRRNIRKTAEANDITGDINMQISDFLIGDTANATSFPKINAQNSDKPGTR